MESVVALQNVVIEHKRQMAVELGDQLTAQVRALGLSDARVWVSFSEDNPTPGASCSKAGSWPVPSARQYPPSKKSTKKSARAAKIVGERKEKSAFYQCNYWRKKKGEAPLTFDAWKTTKAKEQPSKN